MFFLALSLFLQAAGAAQSVVLRTFDDDKIGAPPAGFVLAAGRDGAADRWTVKRESTDKARAENRVLAHEGKPSPPDSFTVAVLSGPTYQEVSVSVRLKAISGGRTAGVVWKYQDPINHTSRSSISRSRRWRYTSRRQRQPDSSRARRRPRARSRRMAFAQSVSGRR